jgi:hypothetical protein
MGPTDTHREERRAPSDPLACLLPTVPHLKLTVHSQPPDPPMEGSYLVPTDMPKHYLLIPKARRVLHPSAQAGPTPPGHREGDGRSHNV